MSLSDEIKAAVEAAKKAGWSENAIADTAGIRQSHLNEWLRGKRGFNLDTAERLAEHFGMRLTKPRRNTGNPPA